MINITNLRTFHCELSVQLPTLRSYEQVSSVCSQYVRQNKVLSQTINLCNNTTNSLFSSMKTKFLLHKYKEHHTDQESKKLKLFS